MQTGSSKTLIGWKSGKTTYVPNGTEWRERGYELRVSGLHSFLPDFDPGFAKKRFQGLRIPHAAKSWQIIF
jgi:hypothetical protein